jgi:hypothetical protein
MNFFQVGLDCIAGFVLVTGLVAIAWLVGLWQSKGGKK